MKKEPSSIKSNQANVIANPAHTKRQKIQIYELKDTYANGIRIHSMGMWEQYRAMKVYSRVNRGVLSTMEQQNRRQK